MEFRLIYQGELKSNARPPEKQVIRRYFHKQLEELWTQVPLIDFRKCLNPQAPAHEITIIQNISPFEFAPLVNAKLHLIAELEITLLRPEPPGRVVTQSGDIDNHVGKPGFTCSWASSPSPSRQVVRWP